MSKEAMKLALEALETERPYLGPMPSKTSKAINVLREALAEQPAQREPVAHFGSAYVNENGVHVTTVVGPVAIPQDAKLYTAPPAQQEPFAKEHEFVQWGVSKYGPLLKAAIDLLVEVDANLESKDVPQKFGVPFGKLNALREALTAAPQPAQQEQLREENERLHVENRRLIDRIETIGVPVGVGGFATTTTAQRTWVGLTDSEIQRLGDLDVDSNYFGLWYDFAKAIEAKLKEKNT